MAKVYVSWTGGVDGSVYVDVASSTEGPFSSNSYLNADLPDADGIYLIRPWCGSIEHSSQVSVSGGVAGPSSISCDLG